MSQIRLYFDEDAGKHSVVQALRNSGIEVITTPEANNLSCSDEEQLIWATQQRRVIYSFNVGLHKIYVEQGRNHAGIIVLAKQSYSVGEQLRGILNLINSVSDAEINKQLVFLGAYISEQ